MSGAVNVRDFGAYGDGVTDDTAAFRVASRFAERCGAKVFVPKGTYLISGNIDTKAPIVGENKHLVTLKVKP